MKKYLISVMMIAVLILPLSLALPALAAIAPGWNTTGSYTVAFNYLGTDYAHDMTLAQDGLGNLTGGGGYPAGGAHVYAWTIVDR